MKRNKQEHGLSAADRTAEILGKFGADQLPDVMRRLDLLIRPTEQLRGAVVFLARPGHVEDIDTLVALANEDPAALLAAATVKDERG